MTDLEAKKLTDEVFELISKSKSIQDLECIPEKLEIIKENWLNEEIYPKLDFSIKQKEIQKLIKNNIIDDQLNFTANIDKKISDPLTKLLYATLWKNGDLKKIRHILKGILNAEEENSEQNEALVFYQFGKYLTKTPGKPIIDQHVIRAYAVYSSTEIKQVKKYRRINALNKTHKILIDQYITWGTSEKVCYLLQAQRETIYYIDKLLYATGKTIKFHK
jgi:hypothetical protein